MNWSLASFGQGFTNEHRANTQRRAQQKAALGRLMQQAQAERDKAEEATQRDTETKAFHDATSANNARKIDDNAGLGNTRQLITLLQALGRGHITTADGEPLLRQLQRGPAPERPASPGVGLTSGPKAVPGAPQASAAPFVAPSPAPAPGTINTGSSRVTMVPMSHVGPADVAVINDKKAHTHESEESARLKGDQADTAEAKLPYAASFASNQARKAGADADYVAGPKTKFTRTMTDFIKPNFDLKRYNVQEQAALKSRALAIQKTGVDGLNAFRQAETELKKGQLGVAKGRLTLAQATAGKSAPDRITAQRHALAAEADKLRARQTFLSTPSKNTNNLSPRGYMPQGGQEFAANEKRLAQIQAQDKALNERLYASQKPQTGGAPAHHSQAQPRHPQSKQFVAPRSLKSKSGRTYTYTVGD